MVCKNLSRAPAGSLRQRFLLTTQKHEHKHENEHEHEHEPKHEHEHEPEHDPEYELESVDTRQDW